MHELSLVESMRELIEEQATLHGFGAVSKVTVEVGALSHIESEALCFCFDSVMKGSHAEQAQLSIISVPGLGQCSECNTQVNIETLYDACPTCGAFGLEILQGNQVRIKNLEVED